MRLPASAHTSRPWRIHAIAADFRLEDVWALPTPGGPEDFPRLVELMATLDPEAGSPLVRGLFALRWKLGALLGWDEANTGLDARVHTLRDRLPADLRDGPSRQVPPGSPFRPVYLTHDECALEMANQTVHGVLHLGWVQDEPGRYRGQMAVLVKPNGRLGSLYMAAIAPFRYLIVYPLMLRAVGRAWAAGATPRATRAGASRGKPSSPPGRRRPARSRS
jgi:hypothetical protein